MILNVMYMTLIRVAFMYNVLYITFSSCHLLIKILFMWINDE